MIAWQVYLKKEKQNKKQQQQQQQEYNKVDIVTALSVISYEYNASQK